MSQCFPAILWYLIVIPNLKTGSCLVFLCTSLFWINLLSFLTLLSIKTLPTTEGHTDFCWIILLWIRKRGFWEARLLFLWSLFANSCEKSTKRCWYNCPEMVIIVMNGVLIQGILFSHKALIMKFKHGNAACIDSCYVIVWNAVMKRTDFQKPLHTRIFWWFFFIGCCVIRISRTWYYDI